MVIYLPLGIHACLPVTTKTSVSILAKENSRAIRASYRR